MGKMSSEEIYDIEEIVESRFKAGKKEYLIKWKGYGPEENTWEVEENILSPEIIKEFEDKKKKLENTIISNEWGSLCKKIVNVYKTESSGELYANVKLGNERRVRSFPIFVLKK